MSGPVQVTKIEIAGNEKKIILGTETRYVRSQSEGGFRVSFGVGRLRREPRAGPGLRRVVEYTQV